jgi:AcrR family transcriptional regulator
VTGKAPPARPTPPRRGRPRGFDPDVALDAALDVFWRKGYEGASLPDLTGAMGINRPSLYAAFGNKEELFKKVLDRYTTGPAAYVQAALLAPTARACFERLLAGAVDALTNPKTPRGCLAVQGALACGDAAESVRKELCARRASAESLLRDRFARARADGDLPNSADPADLAKYATTVLNGLSVQASSGATRAQLRKVADLALRAWPR